MEGKDRRIAEEPCSLQMGGDMGAIESDPAKIPFRFVCDPEGGLRRGDKALIISHIKDISIQLQMPQPPQGILQEVVIPAIISIGISGEGVPESHVVDDQIFFIHFSVFVQKIIMYHHIHILPAESADIFPKLFVYFIHDVPDDFDSEMKDSDIVQNE